MLGDDDPGVGRGEALEPLDDVARPGRIALVGEQRGDRVGVVGRGGAKGDGGAVGGTFGHVGDGTRSGSARGTGCGPSAGPTGAGAPARTARRRARAAGRAHRRRPQAPATAIRRSRPGRPDDHRPLAVARQRRGEPPSVDGSSEHERRQPGRAGGDATPARRATASCGAAPRATPSSRLGTLELDRRPADRGQAGACRRARQRLPRWRRSTAAAMPSVGRAAHPSSSRSGPARRRARTRRAGRGGSRPSLSAKTPRWIHSLPAAIASAVAAASPARRGRGRAPRSPSRSTRGSSGRRTSPAWRPRPARRRGGRGSG